MTVTESNKMIAEFMGATASSDGEHRIWYRFPDGQNHLVNHLKYYSSWEWLMPVVEDIEDNEWFSAYEDSFSSEGNLEVTYNEVVAFIERYNEDNK